MKKIILYLLGIIFLLSGCASFDPLASTIGSYKNYTEVNGKIEDGRFYDPLDRFSMAVPPYLLEPGRRISGNFNKEGGTVTFLDDVGRLIRLDMSSLEEYKKAKFTLPEIYESTVTNIENSYKNITETTYLYGLTTDVKELNSSIAFYSFELKNGSSVTTNGKRSNAIRMSLLFVHGDYIYILTKQKVLNATIDGYNETDDIKKIDDDTASYLFYLYKSFKFPKEK